MRQDSRPPYKTPWYLKVLNLAVLPAVAATIQAVFLHSWGLDIPVLVTITALTWLAVFGQRFGTIYGLYPNRPDVARSSTRAVLARALQVGLLAVYVAAFCLTFYFGFYQ